ncbi:MAG: cellulase family glycosylhydrolase [Planctomycetes bacterium]|nr:cellulase family glycosylhydrolase [Planctomycetota bacterium]
MPYIRMLLLSGITLWAGCSTPAKNGHLAVSPDGKGFVSGDTPFLVWGFNYDRSVISGRDVLLEDVLREQPAKLDRDFATMRQMGGNTVRIFCQMGEYFEGPDRINSGAFDRLSMALDAADRADLKVLLVGLCHIRKSAIPAWLIDADDEMVERHEELFWRTAAGRFRDHPAILAYDLQNEPAVHSSDSRDLVVGCFSMRGGEQFCYVHKHGRQASRRWAEWVHKRYSSEEALQAAWKDYPRPGESWSSPALPKASRQDPRFGNLLACHRDLLQGWARRMRSAIRENDSNHLVTVGALDPAVFADIVDFHCAHLYPKQDLTLEANEQAWRDHLSRVPPGKPIVVEEFYPLAYPRRADGQAATLAELIAALRRAAGPHGAGFVSFYWGPPEEVVDNAIGQALYQNWLDAWSAANRVACPGPSVTRPW